MVAAELRGLRVRSDCCQAVADMAEALRRHQGRAGEEKLEKPEKQRVWRKRGPPLCVATGRFKFKFKFKFKLKVHGGFKRFAKS